MFTYCTKQFFKNTLRKSKYFFIVYNAIGFREGWYGFGKAQCGDPENRITLCRINGIKEEKLMGTVQYIIKAVIDFINN